MIHSQFFQPEIQSTQKKKKTQKKKLQNPSYRIWPRTIRDELKETLHELVDDAGFTGKGLKFVRIYEVVLKSLYL